MEGFCFSVSENTINTLLQTGYQSEPVREALKGKTSIEVMEISVEITWRVSQAPSVSFADIDTSREALDDDGNPLVFDPNMFVVSAAVGLAVTGQEECEVDIEIIAETMFVNNKDVAFKAAGMFVDKYQSADKAIFKGICQDLISAINTVLGFYGGHVPMLFSMQSLEKQGIYAPYYSLVKLNGTMNLCGTFEKSDGFAIGTIPPGKDFALTVTNQVFKVFLNVQFQTHIDGKPTREEFTRDLGITTGKAVLKLLAKQVFCEDIKDGEIFMRVGIDLTAEGSVRVAGTNPGISYKCEFTPELLQTGATLSMNGNHIHGNLCDFKSFTVLLTPAGEWYEQLLGGLVWVLAEAIVNFVTGLIPSVITIPFDIDIKEAEFTNLELYTMKVNITNLMNTYADNMMTVSGNILARLEG
ncbi:MAG: hypothetical protein IKX54_02465 [Lachnospiraceae bacterium]|nr:hypothetical protein [Lachnospiraceae bacterium]